MARALVYQSTNQLVATDSIAAEAHEAASRALLLDPTHADAQLALGINPEQPVYALLAEVKLAAGDAALALELLQHETDARAECWSGTNVFVLRRRTDADAELVALENRSARDAAFGSARIHAYRRDSDQRSSDLIARCCRAIPTAATSRTIRYCKIFAVTVAPNYCCEKCNGPNNPAAKSRIKIARPWSRPHNIARATP